MIQNHPHRTGSHLRRELVRCLACHGSTFSRVGASGKPGAVQSFQNLWGSPQASIAPSEPPLPRATVRLGNVPTRRDGGRLRSCGLLPKLRLADQATTRASRPNVPSHGEQVARQVLDDGRHDTRRTRSLGSRAHPCRQPIAEAGDARLRRRRGTKFHTRCIVGYRGGVRSPGPWSSWETGLLQVTQSRSRSRCESKRIAHGRGADQLLVHAPRARATVLWSLGVSPDRQRPLKQLR